MEEKILGARPAVKPAISDSSESLENKTLEEVLSKELAEKIEERESKNKIDPLEDGISAVELIRVSGSDLDIVNAARVSYGKKSTEVSERDKKLINFLMQHDHTSPFEHNQLSFRIKCPIYIARQWMRHRMNSYNEISYRYVKAELEFYVPNFWREQDKVNKQSSTGSFKNEELVQDYKESIKNIMQVYDKLLLSGVCREQARGLLPLSTYTQFIYTCNLHSLMHFLKLRLGSNAQYEIRCYANALLKLSNAHFPVAFQAWMEKHNFKNLDLE